MNYDIYKTLGLKHQILIEVNYMVKSAGSNNCSPLSCVPLGDIIGNEVITHDFILCQNLTKIVKLYLCKYRELLILQNYTYANIESY